jgi:uncharacterized protein YceK
MKKGIVNKISVLIVFIALSGCTGMTTQNAANTGNRPILSAAEAEAQIRVTVRPLVPIADQESIVAAND